MNLTRKTLNDMVGTKIKFKYQRVTNIIFSCENVKRQRGLRIQVVQNILSLLEIRNSAYTENVVGSNSILIFHSFHKCAISNINISL